MTGAIPGAGRPKKGYIKRNLNLSPEAVAVLDTLPFGEAGKFVSQAILEKELLLSDYLKENK